MAMAAPMLGFIGNIMQMGHQKKMMNAQLAAQHQANLYKGSTEMAMQGNQMKQRAGEVNLDAVSNDADRRLQARQALMGIFQNARNLFPGGQF